MWFDNCSWMRAMRHFSQLRLMMKLYAVPTKMNSTAKRTGVTMTASTSLARSEIGAMSPKPVVVMEIIVK